MLTPRQAECHRFIYRFIRENGYSPSRKEIAEALNTTSMSATQHLISVLVDLGYIEQCRGRPRSLRVLRAPPRRAFKVNDETLQLEEMA